MVFYGQNLVLRPTIYSTAPTGKQGSIYDKSMSKT